MVLEKDHPYIAFISQLDLKNDRLEHLRAQPSQHAGQAAADDIYIWAKLPDKPPATP